MRSPLTRCEEKEASASVPACRNQPTFTVRIRRSKRITPDERFHGTNG
ncbi:MAG: hypothetical protein GY750_19040 [Lentisphaerae bacterium]|nr:hypothetical protein [Lentisphaerota bacterium]